MIVPTDAGDGVHWMSSSIRIQYTSNLMMMRWVSPQFVPAALATALLIKNKLNYCYWGIICAPLILCSTFTFIGMIVLMMILLIGNMLRQKSLESFFQLFSRYNIISIAAGIPLVAYLLLNILQSKPESANFGIKNLDYSENIPLLFCFELSWAIWAMIIWIKGKSNETLGAAVIILFFLPFLSMGEYNDLCMRASIPALSVLCILLAINFVGSLKSNRVYALVIMAALLVSAMGPMKEVASTVSQMNLRERNYIRKYETNEDYFFSYDYVKYQYIAWEETMISTILLQK